MYRGTTPTLTFTLPIEVSSLTKLSVVLSQNKQIVIENDLSDCTYTGKVLTCTLSEDDTLSLATFPDVEIQLRCYTPSGKYASQIWSVPVGRILKDGHLT